MTEPIPAGAAFHVTYDHSRGCWNALYFEDAYSPVFDGEAPGDTIQEACEAAFEEAM